MSKIITKIRLRAAASFSWLATRVAPPTVRPIIGFAFDVAASLPKDMEGGRTGGLIMAPWSVNPEGERLSMEMSSQAGEVCARIRKEWVDAKRIPK